MNYSTIFKNAILNLYKDRIYTVDYAILKATDYADKNKINAEDYELIMQILVSEQVKSMQVEESQDTVENSEDMENTNESEE